MNKTLLLIIVDFLFLNLIALTRWEKAEPVRPHEPPVPQLAANAATSQDQDLVETMRQALVDEQQSREELAQKLSSADSTISVARAKHRRDPGGEKPAGGEPDGSADGRRPAQ